MSSDEERTSREPESEDKAKEKAAEVDVVAVMSETEMNALGAKIIKVWLTIR